MNFESTNLPERPRRDWSSWIILGIISLLTVAGINFIEEFKQTVLCFPDPSFGFNSFFIVMSRTEPAGLYLLFGFCVLMAFVWMAKRPTPLGSLRQRTFSPKKLIWGLAIASFVISAIGTWLVMHNHPLSCDEFLPDFQSEIFLSGKIRADLPADLTFAARALKPLLTIMTPDNLHWTQSYLPVYAAIRAPFFALHLQTFLNPLVGACTVLCIAGIIRLIWPGKPWLAVAGAAMIALSPQILANDMTSYSMPAHLALNTLWLWLYLQPGKRRFWLAPVVGAVALGLHSPFVHALFVVPFLLRLLVGRRWKVCVIFGLIYLAACGGWWSWWHVFAPSNATPGNPLLVWQPKRIGFTQPLNILNLMSWNALPCIFLAVLGLRFYTRLPLVVRDGFMGCLLTFCFYSLLIFDQSYGWGNRYCYGVLGCLVLLAVAGLDKWTERSGYQKPAEFVLVGMLATVLFAIPLRCWQIESFIRPFAKAQESFQKIDADVVIYDSRMAWNSGDLLRNSPFLDNRPLIVNQRYLSLEDAQSLKKKFSQIHFVTGEELADYGLFIKAWQPIDPP